MNFNTGLLYNYWNKSEYYINAMDFHEIKTRFSEASRNSTKNIVGG